MTDEDWVAPRPEGNNTHFGAGEKYEIRVGASLYGARSLCLRFVRLAYGVGPKYPSAISAWKNAKHKEKTTDASDIPVGAPVYFDKPSSEYGHIAVYVGNGKIATTHASTNRTGVDKISTWTGAYGYTMLGWSRDVNGVLVSGGSK